MAQAYLDKVKRRLNFDLRVFFFGYQQPTHSNIYYCANCIDEAVGFRIHKEDESKYIVTGETSLIHFSLSDQRNKSNYCETCKVCLFKIL